MTLRKLPQVEGRSGWPWTDDATIADRPAWSGEAPKVTVVTPSYNQGEFLECTIRSVLLQDYPNLEYIIMDGGSTDGSVEIIRKYEPFLHSWTSARDGGQADAINKGFERATGSVYAWINSDDYYFPGALTHLVRGLMDNGADLAHGDVWKATGHGEPAPWRNGAQTDYLMTLRTLFIPIPQQGAIWTRALWQRVRGLNPGWSCVLDRDFFVRAGLSGQFRYVPGAVAVSRMHPDAKSSALAPRWLVEMPAMYKAFFRRPDLPPTVRSLKRETMYAVWRQCAVLARQCKRQSWPFTLAAGWAAPGRFLRDQIYFMRAQRQPGSPGGKRECRPQEVDGL